MIIIKNLAEDIECNIREANDKIGTAYSLRTEHPAEAMWYKDMAFAHLNFNTKAHELIANLIANYQKTEQYNEHPEYAEGMKAVWNMKHSDMIRETARVKSMIDTFK